MNPAIHTTALPVTRARGVVVRNPWVRNLLSFLMVFGPGLIVMEADNDAGAVSTYVQAGAQYGTHLLWLLVLLLPITYFIQEMVVRLGIATGQGHAAMIYQRFGKWWGMFSLVDLQLLNFLTLVTEFAAIALALQHMNIDPRVGAPVAACALTLLAITGSYRRWERIVVFLCALDLAWLALAIYARPATGEILRNTFVPSVPAGGSTASLVFPIVGIVGTTIAPWQLFFQQSCVADKRLRFADLKWARLDTLIGAAFTIVVAGCMMTAGNAALRHGFTFTDPARMASDLGPKFYGVYVLCVRAAAGLVLIPEAPLQLIIVAVRCWRALCCPPP
jgi:NRAMP (natural resistance-associated macrophage protein)-like metal ion transporter